MDGSGKTPAGLSDTCAIGGGLARRDLAPEIRCTLAKSEGSLHFIDVQTLHLSTAEDVEPAAAFQWAVLAEEAMREGHSERAEEFIELAYSASSF